MAFRSFATITLFLFLVSQKVWCSNLEIRTLSMFCRSLNLGICSCVGLDLKAYETVEFNLSVKLKCESIWFVNSAFATLPKNIFNIAVEGRDFFIRNTQLTSVEGFANAEGLQHVRTLRLDGNHLTYLPNGFLSHASSLEELSIASNGLTTLESECFAGLTKLKLLYLENNFIATLPAEIFRPLTRLKGVHLSRNKLKTIPEQIFSGIRFLSIIYLNNNELTTLPVRLFENLHKLYMLDIGNNQISYIDPECFGSLDRLSFLRLSNNQISELEADTFHNNGLLNRLAIENNSLTTIPPTTFDAMEHLVSLYLGGNKLSSLPENIFSRNRMLQNISLENNELIFDTPDGRLELASVSEKLFYATAERVSMRVFQGLQQLEFLNLSSNTFLRLSEGLFADMPSLQVLDLTNTKCSRIDGNAFSDNSNLRVLRLGSNLLEEFDVQCLPLNSFRALHLNNNSIMRIKNYERFTQFTGKLFVDIEDNSLDCGHLDNITVHLQMHESNAADVECYSVDVDLND